ncbi:hypothetical protein HK104_002856 [Borealophlyctis nickersoniae]|nr:hypothetical protein HK104_002856 [Borealophlyctis nickersoniae]
MDASEVPKWSSRLVAQPSTELTGDRIALPPSCLEDILRLAGPNSTLPSPLTFELVNGSTRGKIYGSVREFTAMEGRVELSPATARSLGVVASGDALEQAAGNGDGEGSSVVAETSDASIETQHYVTVKLVQLPKATFAKLAPLEVDYLDISDMRSTLESHLRQNWATLTLGETISVSQMSPRSRQIKQYPFLVTELLPAPGCLIIDTDMEVDIAPLDQSIAEEAVKRKFALSVGDSNVREIGLEEGASMAEIRGRVSKGESQYYSVKAPAGLKHITVEVEPDGLGDADLFISTRIEQPSIKDHDYANVDIGVSAISFQLPADISEAPFIYIGVQGYAPTTEFTLRLSIPDQPPSPQTSRAKADEVSPGPDYAQCSNCHTYVPQRTIVMHEAFCKRNNAVCGWCGAVMKKEDLPNHWHCDQPGCKKVGHVSERDKHIERVHTPIACECGVSLPMSRLAEHRATMCPERLIVCRFCKLCVRAGNRSFTAKDLLLGTGITEHESECGARTIQCVKCKRPVQLKDVQTHAKMHEVEKRNQPIFRLCANQYCATSSDTSTVAHPMDPTSAAVLIITLLKQTFLGTASNPQYYFCVADAGVSKRRVDAETLKGMGFSVAWGVRALMECGDDVERAGAWLVSNAPTTEEG